MTELTKLPQFVAGNASFVINVARIIRSHRFGENLPTKLEALLTVVCPINGDGPQEHATQPTKSGIAVYQEERRRRPYGQPSPRCWGVAKLPADEMTVEPIVGLVRQTVRQGGASERRNGLRNHVDVLFAALLAAEELVSAICLNCSAAA
jgi:hypothetical protein